MNLVAVIRLLCLSTALCLLICPGAYAIHGEAKKKLTEGYEALKQREFLKAQKSFEDALELSKAQGDSSEAIDFLEVEVAGNKARLGHPSKALFELKKIQGKYDAQAKKDGHKSQWYNHLLRAQALCYTLEKRYDNAIQIYKQIIQDEDKEDTKDDAASDRVQTRVAYVKVLMLQGEHQKGQEILNELIARQSPGYVGDDIVLQAEGMLAASYLGQKNYADAQKHAQIALSIAEKRLDKYTLQQAYLTAMLAAALGEQDKYAEAAPLFKEAEGLLTKAGREVGIEFFEAYEKCLKKLGATADLERVTNEVEELKKAGKAKKGN